MLSVSTYMTETVIMLIHLFWKMLVAGVKLSVCLFN